MLHFIHVGYRVVVDENYFVVSKFEVTESKIFWFVSAMHCPVQDSSKLCRFYNCILLHLKKEGGLSNV